MMHLNNLAGPLAAASLLVLSACTSAPETATPDARYFTTNDFESVVGWETEGLSITDEHAHSGRLAVRVNQDREYGHTYDRALSQLSPRAISAIEAEGWVYLSGPGSTGALVVQVVQGSGAGFKVLYSQQLNLTDRVKDYGSWQPVQWKAPLTANLPADAHLRFFLWRNNATEPLYLDDIRLRIAE
ncbi:hypothetical protein [Hymenobacter metallilatus]|uniref:CBM-cenC domain-containing protein n=1 Tax=Hymenobacter metallilatus TaxID=2493666 RepID=A0A428JFJ9_9BACT|nr:hypothetical protein [Hymenobacter metallilatus]RSK31161.1 hypothetical protein EI290_14160 [Hymenobacter metallilatus]